MKILKIAILLVPFLFGCISNETKSRVKDQHAVYNVYIRSMDGNKTTREQDQQMVKSAALSFQALDREVNGWQPSIVMPEIKLDPKP